MEAAKNKIGRKQVPEELRKKSRGISLTDSELAELNRQARENSLEPSRYIIWKLQLGKTVLS